METTAREIMSTEMMKARPDMSIEQALKILVNNKITGLPVVDKEGRMVGVVSEYDILVQLSQESKVGPESFRKPIQYMRDVEAIQETTRLPEIHRLFIEKRYRRLPVLSAQGKLVGIITRRDLMRIYYYRATLG